MKICYSVLLSLVIINHLMCEVHSNWSIRKIFADNIEADNSKRVATELNDKTLTTVVLVTTTAAELKNTLAQEQGEEPSNEEEEEEDETNDNEEVHVATRNKKNGKKDRERLMKSVLIKNHHSHLLGEIIPIGNNSQGFEIVLKPKIIKKSSNKKICVAKSKMNKKHHHNSFKHKNKNNDADNQNEEDSNNINIFKEHNKIEEEEDYQEENNDNNSGDEEEENVEENSTPKKQKDLIHVKCKIRGKERFKVIPLEILNENDDAKKSPVRSKNLNGNTKRQRSTTAANTSSKHTSKTVHREVMNTATKKNLLSSTLEAVKVNGSVEGIIVMSFNFSDDGKKQPELNIVSSNKANNKNCENDYNVDNDGDVDNGKVNVKNTNHKNSAINKNINNNEINVISAVDETTEVNVKLKEDPLRRSNSNFLILTDKDDNELETRCKICNARINPPSSKLSDDDTKNNVFELYEVEEKIVSKPKKARYYNCKHKNCNKKCKHKKLIAKDSEE